MIIIELLVGYFIFFIFGIYVGLRFHKFLTTPFKEMFK